MPPEPIDAERDLTLPPEAAGLRLDRALAIALPDFSRTMIQGWIDAERVLVNGQPLPRRARVEGGEVVHIRVPPPKQATVDAEDIPLQIVFEDEYLIVVDKPAGLTVHPGAGQPSGTLANALVHHARNLPELIGSDRPGIVHRLDKDTSGVIVVAKTDLAQRRLSEAFAERTVKKTYLAVVHGNPEDDSGRIALPLGRHLRDRKKMAVREQGGRDARTDWQVEHRLPRHSLLRCSPHTGRTHQIRVHLVAIRHPILGDPIYGNRGLAGEELDPGLMLHALAIRFEHPITKEGVHFEAPPPTTWTPLLERLAALPPVRGRGRRR